MAAHHYRALFEVYNRAGHPDLTRQAKDIRFEIGNAPAFMFLDNLTYTRLAEWCDKVIENGPEPDYRENLRTIVMEQLPAIGQEWLDLGKPQCEEDWGKAKYPPAEVDTRDDLPPFEGISGGDDGKG